MKISICNSQRSLKIRPRVISRLMRIALEQEGKDAELSVAIVGDKRMRRLNERFLGRRRTTDVLAFPYDASGSFVRGEIIANAHAALREAATRPHTAEDELLLYLVHGLLHLLGYNDDTPEQARRMRLREQRALRAAGRRVQF